MCLLTILTVLFRCVCQFYICTAIFECKMTHTQLYAGNYEIITIISLSFHNVPYIMKWKFLKNIQMKCINVHIALNSLFSYSPTELTRLTPLTTSFTREYRGLHICSIDNWKRMPGTLRDWNSKPNMLKSVIKETRYSTCVSFKGRRNT